MTSPDDGVVLSLPVIDAPRPAHSPEGAESRIDGDEAFPQPFEADDRIREVPEIERAGSLLHRGEGATAPAFVLARMQTLEKPTLEEELVEPTSSTPDPCSCNAVCPCVPDQVCACNEVCACNTVEDRDDGGGGGGGGGCNRIIFFAPCF